MLRPRWDKEQAGVELGARDSLVAKLDSCEKDQGKKLEHSALEVHLA